MTWDRVLISEVFEFWSVVACPLIMIMDIRRPNTNGADKVYAIDILLFRLSIGDRLSLLRVGIPTRPLKRAVYYKQSGF